MREQEATESKGQRKVRSEFEIRGLGGSLGKFIYSLTYGLLSNTFNEDQIIARDCAAKSKQRRARNLDSLMAIQINEHILDLIIRTYILAHEVDASVGSADLWEVRTSPLRSR